MIACGPMQPADWLRSIVPLLLAAGLAWWLDRRCESRGLEPPGFEQPWRRLLAGVCVAGVLWAGVTAPLGLIGRAEAPADVSKIATPQLFLLHLLMASAAVAWFLLGFAGVRPPAPEAPAEPMALDPAQMIPPPLPPLPPVPLARRFAEQFGLVAPDVPREIGLGLLLGVGAWAVVLVGVMLIATFLIYVLGQDKLIPKEPPALVPWIAGLPVLIRVGVSLSAGVVEEGFFRGFLQPRVGILLSTALFVLAHFSYGQPFMLVGIGILSLIYALLVRWRQTIWPAIAAHALFDGVQLLVVIPGALRLMQTHGPKAASFLSFLGFC